VPGGFISWRAFVIPRIQSPPTHSRLILEGSLRDYITDEEKRQFHPLLCALQKLFRIRSTLPGQNDECRSAGLFGRAISEVHSRAQAQIDDVIIRQLFMGIGAAGELSRPNLFGGTALRK
jgi:hypothetical protein